MCWVRTAVSEVLPSDSKSGLRRGGGEAVLEEAGVSVGARVGLCGGGGSIGRSPAAWPSPECSAGAAGWR